MVTGVGSVATDESYEGGATPVTKRVSPIERCRRQLNTDQWAAIEN
ncbi:hypothetical protein [Mycobacterium sp.]